MNKRDLVLNLEHSLKGTIDHSILIQSLSYANFAEYKLAMEMLIDNLHDHCARLSESQRMQVADVARLCGVEDDRLRLVASLHA